MYRVMGYDGSGLCPLILCVRSFGVALDYCDLEMRDFGNPFRLVRIDIYGPAGFIVRRNVQ